MEQTGSGGQLSTGPKGGSQSIAGAGGGSKDDSSGSHHKRNYFWCPVVDCASGPVQKVTQHLSKVHKMDAATAAKVARKKRRAPLEAVRLKIPNPQTRSSGLQHLGLFAEKSPSATSAGQSPPVKDTSTTTSPPPCTPSTSSACYDGNFHQGGTFLDGFYSHLRSRAGGNRGEHSAKQIERYVAKYLYALDALRVEERGLLRTEPVIPYLERIQRTGIGSSGVLHRILAHKAAVNYMRLGVSYH